MEELVRRALASHTDDFRLRRRLHDVPPHVVYEVEFRGRRAVCKVSTDDRGRAAVEGRVLRYVGRELDVPVPEVLAVGAEGFVAAYREDAPEEPAPGEGRVGREWLDAAGRALARLHDESTFDRPGLLAVAGDPSDSAAGLAVDADPGATWSDALDDLLAVYERSVGETGYADVVADARAFLATHADRFDVLDDRDPALLHGWFTPDHVAVVDGEATCVVDFEHALVGGVEWDYWRTAVPLFHGTDRSAPADAAERFRRGYESVRPLPDGFAARADAYRAFVSVSYLDSLHTQRGIDDQTHEQANFLREHVTDALATLRAEWA